MVMVEAMKKADSVDPAKYGPLLSQVSIDGVTSHINFDENGDLKGGVVTVYQDVGGKWVPQEVLGGAN